MGTGMSSRAIGVTGFLHCTIWRLSFFVQVLAYKVWVKGLGWLWRCFDL